MTAHHRRRKTAHSIGMGVTIALIAALAGCTGPDRLEVATDRADAAQAHHDQIVARYRRTLDWCRAEGRSCTAELDYLDVELEVADREADAADAALNRLSAADSDRRQRLFNAGMATILQPSGPTICRTSDTTNPTTVCQ